MMRTEIGEGFRRKAALKKARDRLIHMAHSCDMEDEFQVFTIGVLGFILEGLDPDLAMPS